MQATMKCAFAFVLTGFGFLGDGTKAQAFNYRHIDNLALRLQRETRDMHREVHAHFRATPMFRHLDADVARMEQLARHIHEVAHNGGSIRHLRADVEKLDHLFHHIEDLIRQMARTCNVDRRALSHFYVTMRGINFTLHHLRADLRAMDYHDPNHYLPQPGHGHPARGHSGHGYSGYSGYSGQGAILRIGNSCIGVRVRIR